jgi:hypothetical protein
MSTLLHTLKSRFDPARAGELDATLEFNWPAGRCRVSVHDGSATFYENDGDAPDAELVIFFRDEAQAVQIISGQDNPVDAFMRGEFRSNGYLVWVFQTLAAFSKASS